MMYEDVVADFAQPTRKNLQVFRSLPSQDYEVFEVTQLINSMTGGRKLKNLKEFVRYLRNAIAHFNIQFIGDSQNAIRQVRV